jgi:hypothetical protein
MRHKDKKAKDRITVEIRQQDDFKPGFAAYLEGSLNCSGKANVVLNVSNLMGTVAAKELAPKEIPAVVADCIFHEFLHVVEEWAGLAFSEKRIHRLVEKYRKLYEKKIVRSGANKNRKKQFTTNKV